MTPLRHVMILASAGSGKTYALTNRFVALLAAGAPAERIVALTFTRKAAGEFFDEILHKLARAARDETAARQLARDIGAVGGPGDFLRLLRELVDGMHRLRLGTLDSFFARVARAFPFELGLAGEFEILQEYAARLERQRVLQRMFARTGGAPDAAQTEFIEAFKRATFGAEEKRLGARLDAFLDAYHENFLAAPDDATWGRPERIWPDGSAWLAPEIDLPAAVRELRSLLGPMTEGQRLRWENFFLALDEWIPGAPLAAPIEYLLKNALDVWRDIGAGEAEIVVDRRKLALSAAACRTLERIVRHLVGAEIRRRIEMTRGIFAVLRSYEATYHDAVRRAGRLTFADVQRLLAPVALTSGIAPSVADEGKTGLEQAGTAPADAGERRLLLDYRLDAEIDHWLLDEFQDTSYGQWSILRNLIDEVVQDAEGRRSFFCVGDVKQAIYSWREGDPRLLREIFDHYNQAAPGVIEEQHLVASWRSGPALIELVNTVFGAAATLSELFPGEASATWNREWRRHESAVPDRIGQAALLHAVDEADRWATVRRLLEAINPLERGMTCAILVRKNDTAAALADFLRDAGIPAIAESDLHIATDNPLGAALLALVQTAAHPGDTLAAEHVRMTPLGRILAADGLTTTDALTRRVLDQVHADGFERALEYWIDRLESELAPADAFSRWRAREFSAAAGLFDATGSRDCDEFVAFMERHVVRPAEGAAVVRVMTVHKSKGLGFDVVVLPDLQGNRIDERRDGLAVQKSRDRSVRWVLDLPPKLFAAQDEVLAAHVQAAEAEACYENLSLLYVALTRAKRGLYVITEPVGKSKSRNFPRLLAATLGEESRELAVGGSTFTGAWSSGDPNWPARVRPADEARLPAVPIARVEGDGGGALRRVMRRPSGRSEALVSGAALFSLDTAAAAEFGTELHELLAEVEWLEQPAKADACVAAWRKRQPAPPVLAAAEACLRGPDLAEVWRRPEAPVAEVWRERSFEIVLDDTWTTGVFDRVVIVRAENGSATRATVYDFKTDRVANQAALARHAPQLNLYRRVVAVLTGLPATAVTCEVVFTRVGQRMRVPA